MNKKGYERHSAKVFEQSLRRYLAAGVPAKRGMSRDDYVRACRALWERTQTDQVYRAKLFFEPIVDTQFAEHSNDFFCVLVARCDPDGRLMGAGPGYQRPGEEGVFLSKVVIGSPPGSVVAKEKINNYLLAYFDIVGFKNSLQSKSLSSVYSTYTQLIKNAVHPQRASFTKATTISSSGESVPAFMWTPIDVAYASDSIVVYVPYHPQNFPANQQLIEEFLSRAALLFCSALRCRVPLRGVITFGEAVFNAKRSVFIGPPLVEASTLEQELDWIGVALGKSMQQEIPIPPRLVQIMTPPMSPEGQDLFGGLVLDWPRVWRATFPDSAESYLAEMSTPHAPPKIQARYEQAIRFVELSNTNQNWCIPEGATMITPDDVWKQMESRRQ